MTLYQWAAGLLIWVAVELLLRVVGFMIDPPKFQPYGDLTD